MDYDYIELIDGRVIENAFEDKDKAFSSICAIYEALHRDVHDPMALLYELEAAGLLEVLELEEEILLKKVFDQARLRLRHRYRDPELDPSIVPLPAALASWQHRPERPVRSEYADNDLKGKVVPIFQSMDDPRYWALF